MIAQHMITENKIQQNEAAVQAAMQLLTQRPTSQHWVCEVCGMLHTGATPDACDSCGVSMALVRHHGINREMNSRW
jgi:rubrerythrin